MAAVRMRYNPPFPDSLIEQLLRWWAVPRRSAVLFTLILWVFASLSVWIRSYWRYDALALGGWAVASESGAVYVLRSVETLDHYLTGRAGENGQLEVETGSTHRPWL